MRTSRLRAGVLVNRPVVFTESRSIQMMWSVLYQVLVITPWSVSNARAQRFRCVRTAENEFLPGTRQEAFLRRPGESDIFVTNLAFLCASKCSNEAVFVWKNLNLFLSRLCRKNRGATCQLSHCSQTIQTHSFLKNVTNRKWVSAWMTVTMEEAVCAWLESSQKHRFCSGTSSLHTNESEIERRNNGVYQCRYHSAVLWNCAGCQRNQYSGGGGFENDDDNSKVTPLGGGFALLRQCSLKTYNLSVFCRLFKTDVDAPRELQVCWAYKSLTAGNEVAVKLTFSGPNGETVHCYCGSNQLYKAIGGHPAKDGNILSVNRDHKFIHDWQARWAKNSFNCGEWRQQQQQETPC